DPVTRQFGLGPVSTTVADVTGDGIPDLLVSSPQSDNVFQINGVGRGLFNDRAPVVFATGTDSAPVQALVGQFDARPGLDLVTINAGSSSLTLFSAFATALTIGSGGERPVAALAGDFNRDGHSDLIVANNDDGRVVLLLGTEDGPALARVFTAEGLAHPTDVALSGDGTQLYVSGDGEEAVTRFTLDLGTAVPVPISGLVFGGGEPGQRLPDVLPLQGSSVATVATFLTVARAEDTLAGAESRLVSVILDGDGDVPTTLFNISVLVVPSFNAPVLLAPGGGDAAESAEGTEEGLSTKSGMLLTQSAEAKADGLTIGLDEALQRSGAGLRELLLQEDEAPAPASPPEGTVDEVFRRWLTDRGRDLVGAELVVRASSLGDIWSAGFGALVALREAGLVQPDALSRQGPPSAAPAAEQDVSSDQREGQAGWPEARLWENGLTLPQVLLAAGLVSSLWLYRRGHSGQRLAPSRTSSL
ncbi:MAG TPA: hypothetical protein VKD72_39515, partial [Gemmataceae bacterium]|nr:hypothetical protein [Gemmataceae bacterium]